MSRSEKPWQTMFAGAFLFEQLACAEADTNRQAEILAGGAKDIFASEQNKSGDDPMPPPLLRIQPQAYACSTSAHTQRHEAQVTLPIHQ
jgi:hypothetical protein